MMVIIDDDDWATAMMSILILKVRLEMQRVRSHHYHHDCW